MQRKLENYFLNVINHKQKGLMACLLRSFLWLLSWPYRAYVKSRNWFFDQGLVSRYFPPVPIVISIGNIVVGGTGKTPVTLMIAHEFYQEFLVAVLSRGYRSPAERLPIPIVLCKGEGPLQSASFCGDEPYLIAQNIPKAFVIVGKNRHKASDIAARAGAEVILLDDGMQHRRLARDYEVVVMDTTDPFAQGYHLPRGLLREGVESLARADLIILNHIKDAESFESIKQQVSKYSTAIVVGTRMEVVLVETFAGEQIASLKGKKVGIFCGIARPEYFKNTVAAEGAIIVDSVYAGDHMGFRTEVLNAFSDRCKSLGAEILLCTEKDKVKIQDVKNLSLPIAYLKMRLNLLEGQKEWSQFMGNIKETLRSRT